MTGTTAADLSQFEAATIRTGSRVDVVLRRKGPDILTRLDPATRQTVATYIATAEVIMAGGAVMPRDSLSAGSPGGSPGSREGRQSSMVDQVRFLRTMEDAVAIEAIQVGTRDPVSLPALDVWRAVCLGDAPAARILSRTGLKRTRSRVADLNMGFAAAAERVAIAIGDTRPPF
jgi:hypothetical protein